MTTEQRIYNLRPSLTWVSRPQDRVSVHPFAAANLPATFLPDVSNDIVDQGQLGSCTANQMMALLFDFQKMLGLNPFLGDRLNQYYLERAKEGNPGTDSGATIADTVATAMQFGFAKEIDYNTSRFAQPPSQDYLTVAKLMAGFFSATMLQSDVATQKAFIYNGDGKYPLSIIYGFAVYPQFEQVDASGNIAMPSGQELGGHANRRRGWDDTHRNLDGSYGAYWTPNCWGTGWGEQGYGWLPYNYPIWDVWGCKPVMAPTPSPIPTPADYFTHIDMNITWKSGLQWPVSANVVPPPGA